MKKHGVIINMTNDFLHFWPGYYTHIRATSSTILSPLSLPTQTTAVRIEKAITPQKMIKRGSKKDMTNFLQMPDKLSGKKRRQMNKSKRKASIRETSSRTAMDIGNLFPLGHRQ